VSCDAKKPLLITSTKLRKHVATLSQIINLRQNELDILASFLGHDLFLHQNYYRLPQDTLYYDTVYYATNVSNLCC